MATPSPGPEQQHDWLGGGAIGVAIFFFFQGVRLLMQALKLRRVIPKPPRELPLIYEDSALLIAFRRLRDEVRGDIQRVESSVSELDENVRTIKSEVKRISNEDIPGLEIRVRDLATDLEGMQRNETKTLRRLRKLEDDAPPGDLAT